MNSAEREPEDISVGDEDDTNGMETGPELAELDELEVQTADRPPSDDEDGMATGEEPAGPER